MNNNLKQKKNNTVIFFRSQSGRDSPVNSIGTTDARKIFTHSKKLPERFLAAYVAA